MPVQYNNKQSTFLSIPASLISNTKTVVFSKTNFVSGVVGIQDPSKSGMKPGIILEEKMIRDFWGQANVAPKSEVGVEAMSFSMPNNPVGNMYLLHAEVNLFKIRNGMNIAGIPRALEPFAAPTDTSTGIPYLGINGNIALPANPNFKPSQYQFEFLIERAKQLTNIAQQMESMMLSALEKLDAETYSVEQARQQIKVARETIKLHNFQVKRAEQEVDLASLQVERADVQLDYFSKLLADGLLFDEEAAIGFLWTANVSSTVAALAGAWFGAGESATSGIYRASSTYASIASTSSQISSMIASFTRRAQEWDFQKRLASKDMSIAKQSEKIARTGVQIAGQELEIAKLSEQNANEMLNFLRNKFSNAELYNFMSKELSKVYFTFLNMATNMAKLAQNQLSFQRQEVVQATIQDSYRELPSSNTENKPDRRGITGSAKLLQHIYELEQQALDNYRRKHQLTKTISLAYADPAAFEQFKQTGILNFQTTLSQFDRDFPGHYLRLIKQVKTSVIALIPPIDGIKATLSNTGISRVVSKSNKGFSQEVIMNTQSDAVALTSAIDATGLFEMQQVDHTLKPFEGFGVETQWTFEMQKAANYFDYSTIADVLFTIEYTALFDSTYKNQITKELDDTIDAYRVFSLKNNFPDQWYDLNNQNKASNTSYNMTLNIARSEYPSMLKSDPIIKNTSLFFVLSDGFDKETDVSIDGYQYKTPTPKAETVSLNEKLRMNTKTNQILGLDKMNSCKAFGDLTLTFPSTTWFNENGIKDVVLLINYTSDLPPFI